MRDPMLIPAVFAVADGLAAIDGYYRFNVKEYITENALCIILYELNG